MARRLGLSRGIGYALMAFLLAGCLVSGAVTIMSEGRNSTVNPWVVGFGGSFLFVVIAVQAVTTALSVGRSWLLRLFGEDQWAMLTDKTCRTDSEDTLWTAHVEGAGFRQAVYTGPWDPGPVGQPVRVRRHAASNQVRLLPVPAPAGTLIADILIPVGLILVAAVEAAIGYGLVRGAIEVLR